MEALPQPLPQPFNILKAYATAASPFISNRGEFMFWVVIVVC